MVHVSAYSCKCIHVSAYCWDVLANEKKQAENESPPAASR